MSRFMQRTYLQTPINNVRTDLDVITAWNPLVRAISCANCRHCKVSADSSGLSARCNKGHGKGLTRPLLGIIRENNPRGFRDASKCDDFTSMSDDKE